MLVLLLELLGASIQRVKSFCSITPQVHRGHSRTQDLFQCVVRLSTRQPSPHPHAVRHRFSPNILTCHSSSEKLQPHDRQHLAGVSAWNVCLPDFKPTCLTKQPLLSNTCGVSKSDSAAKKTSGAASCKICDATILFWRGLFGFLKKPEPSSPHWTAYTTLLGSSVSSGSCSGILLLGLSSSPGYSQAKKILILQVVPL